MCLLSNILVAAATVFAPVVSGAALARRADYWKPAVGATVSEIHNDFLTKGMIWPSKHSQPSL